MAGFYGVWLAAPETAGGLLDAVELADRLLQEGLGVDKIASHILMKDAKPYRGAPVTTGR